MKKTKRGQLFSQPFTIIFSLFVMSLIIFFGYRAITGVANTGEKVCNVKLQQDFQNEVNDLYTQPLGSSAKLSVSTCASMKGICVLDLNKITDTHSILYKDIQETVQILLESTSKKNLFFSSTNSKTTFEALTINKLKPNSVVCDSTLDGKINLLLENKGTYVDAKKTS